MDLGIKERVAIVGGSSRGMGKATALAFAREGAKVTICARNEEDLRKAEYEIARASSQMHVLAVAADLSSYDDIRHVVRHTLNRFSRIDILVNNVGGPPVGNPSALEDERWHQALEQNFLSAVRMSREVIPCMKQQQWGRIINLLSTAVKQPIKGLVLSTAARMGVVGFAKMLAAELARDNITVNNVLAGSIQTDRLVSFYQTRAQEQGRSVEEVLQQATKAIPMGRLGKPEEMADLILFLASERAGYITGASIPLDGGLLQATL